MPERYDVGERAPVWRVTVSIGDEKREYEDCWITIDHQDHVVHIWTDRAPGPPAVTAPFVATLIEWKRI